MWANEHKRGSSIAQQNDSYPTCSLLYLDLICAPSNPRAIFFRVWTAKNMFTRRDRSLFCICSRWSYIRNSPKGRGPELGRDNRSKTRGTIIATPWVWMSWNVIGILPGARKIVVIIAVERSKSWKWELLLFAAFMDDEKCLSRPILVAS